MKKIATITTGVLAVTLLIFATGYKVAKKYDIVFQSPIKIISTDVMIQQATIESPLDFEESEDVFALLNEEIDN